jgi:hypothetical protein
MLRAPLRPPASGITIGKFAGCGRFAARLEEQRWENGMIGPFLFGVRIARGILA